MTNLLAATRRSDIAFHRSGKIDITARISRALDIRPGDVVGFCCDNKELYVYIRLRSEQAEGRHIGECRPTKRGSHNFRAWSRDIADAVFSLVGAPPEVHSLRLYAGECSTLPGCLKAVTLIYRHLINNYG